MTLNLPLKAREQLTQILNEPGGNLLMDREGDLGTLCAAWRTLHLSWEAIWVPCKERNAPFRPVFRAVH